MTGTRCDQPLPGSDCVGYLLNLKPGADLTAEDLARLARLDDGPFEPDQDDDPADWDLPSWAETQRLLMGDPDGAPVPEIFDAGFTRRDGGGGRGFAAGGPLDQMEPGGTLTAFTERAWEEGLGRLSDDELVGVMAAARRGASRPGAPGLAARARAAGRRAGG